MSAAGEDRRLLLVGMMGAGKSTVGSALSARLGWPYLDNDELVRRATGEPTPDVLDQQGVVRLREVESRALTEALTLDPPLIAGVAGGVVESAADRARLRGAGCVVWLRASIDTLVDRVGTGAGRPWLRPDPRTALERLYAGREALYAEVAGLVVDVDALSADAIADRIVTGCRLG